MSKLGFVFVIVVLALATLLPMATSANRSVVPSVPTPTPMGDLPATITPPGPDILDRLGYEGAPDPQEMEQFRRQLLDFLDDLYVLVDQVPPGADYRSYARASLKKAKREIQELTHEQLHLIQVSFEVSGTDLQVVRANVQRAKSLVLTPGRKPERSPDSFSIIPTPTPVRTPAAPSVSHTNDEQTNSATGDLFPPGWPTDVGCPEQGYPAVAVFPLMITLDALEGVRIGLEAFCKEKTVFGTNPQDPIQCTVQTVFEYVIFAVQQVHDGFVFCNGNVASARTQAIFEDTKIVHADLAAHDANLHTRFNATDRFLFDFRNLNLRLNIEANLASPDDNPRVLYALPRSVCISSDLETLQQSDPFAPEVIAGCGLLEVVSDTVRSAIDMTAAAGQGISNAEAEFQAAVAHYNNGEWKLAYARFRKAYREAVKP